MITFPHMTYTTQRQRAMRIAEEKAVFSSGDAARRGVHSQVLTRMVEEGRLERVARGRYRFPGAPLTENHNLALVAGAVLHGDPPPTSSSERSAFSFFFPRS